MLGESLRWCHLSRGWMMALYGYLSRFLKSDEHSRGAAKLQWEFLS